MEQAGRILRAQATRKQVLPDHSAAALGRNHPSSGGEAPSEKDYRQIRGQVRALRAEQQESGKEADAYVAMTNLIEQACNHYLETRASLPPIRRCRPSRCEPLGQLPFAADDSMHAGQTYRALLSLAQSRSASPGKRRRPDQRTTAGDPSSVPVRPPSPPERAGRPGR